MDERAGTKMGWSWDCGKERRCLESTSESKDQSKQQEPFIIPKAAHIAAAAAVCAPCESQAVPALVVPQNHVRGQRSSLGQNECFSVSSAISECFQYLALFSTYSGLKVM